MRTRGDLETNDIILTGKSVLTVRIAKWWNQKQILTKLDWLTKCDEIHDDVWLKETQQIYNRPLIAYCEIKIQIIVNFAILS